jgi:hypothetical protein
MRFPSATSHVLLAACRQDEQALEENFDGTHHGRFTKHLIDRLVATDLENTTNEELINGVPIWERQTPHCGGIGRNLVVFKGCYPATGPHAVTLMPYPDPKIPLDSRLETSPDFKSSQVFQVKMGIVEGVVRGTEFSVHAPDNTFLCTFVAQSVKVNHTILARKAAGPSIPRGSRAVVSDWKNKLLLLVHIPADFPYDLFPTISESLRRTHRFVRAPSLEKAHIIVRWDGKDIVIERRTGLMSKYKPKILVAFNGSPARLLDAMDGIAHFNYFLDHTKAEPRPLKDKFMLQMHHLQGVYPNRKPASNMVKYGKVQFVSKDDAKYGFTIFSNKNCSDALFPYLFYFDSDRYTIQVSVARNPDSVLIFVR